MNQTLFLLLGVLGLAGLGSLISSNDDNHGPETPSDPFKDRTVTEGTDEAETLEGTAADDAILSYDGDDLVDGKGGNDLIYTGRGDDTVVANPGDDGVYLGRDDDLYGAYNPGADEGSDTVVGGSGDDVIITNGGEHRVFGDDDPDHIDYEDNEPKGDDSIYDNGGTVYAYGGRGNDLIWSPDDSDQDNPDTLLGGEGDDTIYAGAYDIVEGGKGSDLYILNGDAAGPADITYGSSDSIQIALPDNYSGSQNYELLQDGDNVRLVLDGNDLAVLRDISVKDVGKVTFIDQSATPTPPWLSGSN